MAKRAHSLPSWLQACVDNWYTTAPPPWWARVLAAIFHRLVSIRRALYEQAIFSRYRAPVPVIVVGNITLGGTGKTPLVAWLVRFLQLNGWRPGIVCRGYGGQAATWPQHVTPDSDAHRVGDEAVLLARQCSVPVVAAPRRVEAVQTLLQKFDCDVVVCDDGLQHYALQRDLEIVVVDGVRRWGNGYVLPAGPLREPVARARQAHFVLVYGQAQTGEFAVNKRIVGFRRVCGNDAVEDVTAWRGRRVRAVAGIGHPQQFFDQLRQLGLEVVPHAFPDHHAYTASDLDFHEHLPIVMTEKDAVKCRHFGVEDAWYAALAIDPDPQWVVLLQKHLAQWSTQLKKVGMT